jgi:thiamine-phosphate pyrophosphorylase
VTANADQSPSRGALPQPVLMLVTDGSRLAGHHTDQDAAIARVCGEAVRGGVPVAQLRQRARSTAARIALGARVRETIGHQAMQFVTSDMEAAIALRADGLHLPEHGAPTSDARARIGGSVLISRAVHSTEAAVVAEREGVDFVVLGTVFASASHPDGPTIGVDGIRASCEAVTLPVIAIGGITAENAGAVMHAGAAGVAVIGAILDAADPCTAAVLLRAAMDVAVPVRRL